MAIHGLNWIGFTVMMLMVIDLVLFASLTVTINADVLKLHFGAGFVRKTFLLKYIIFCQVVKNPWYYGWGIQWTPHGWLKSFSGTHAVESTLRNAKKYRVGTDVFSELSQAIRQAIKGDRK